MPPKGRRAEREDGFASPALPGSREQHLGPGSDGESHGRCAGTEGGRPRERRAGAERELPRVTKRKTPGTRGGCRETRPRRVPREAGKPSKLGAEDARQDHGELRGRRLGAERGPRGGRRGRRREPRVRDATRGGEEGGGAGPAGTLASRVHVQAAAGLQPVSRPGRRARQEQGQLHWESLPEHSAASGTASAAAALRNQRRDGQLPLRRGLRPRPAPTSPVQSERCLSQSPFIRSNLIGYGCVRSRKRRPA